MEFRGIRLTGKDAREIVDEIFNRPPMTPERRKFIKECLESAKDRNKRRKYTLEEFTEQCNSENRHEEIDWGNPVGKEKEWMNDEMETQHPNEWRKNNGIDGAYGLGLVDLYEQGK